MSRKAPTPPVRLPDGRVLVSRRVLAYVTGRNIETVTRHCQPIACDVVNRTPLYEAEREAVRLATRRASVTA